MKKLSSLEHYKGDENLWVYNGQDCCVTLKLFGEMRADLDDVTGPIYDFSKKMLGPALTMMDRGFLINTEEVNRLVPELWNAIERISGWRKGPKPLKRGGFSKKEEWQLTNPDAPLQQIAQAIWRRPLNPNSKDQVQELLTEYLSVPPQYKFEKGVRKQAVDREALENIIKAYPRARMLCKLIQFVRDTNKQISVLSAPLINGRMHFQYKITGTETGRWSSKGHNFGGKAQGQNITKEMRRVFIPDPGYAMFYCDLEQAESRAVAYLARDEAYINACESGDLHTTVSKLIWPELPWTNDLENDKKLADTLKVYRHFTYRDMAKRGGHGTSYYGTPRTMASHLHIETKVMELFQAKFLGGELYSKDLRRWGYTEFVTEDDLNTVVKFPGAFPKIREWHNEVIQTVQSEGVLTTPFGRRRKFYGRPNDATTHREAIAFVPQSTVGDILNAAMFQVWWNLEPLGLRLLGQVHDAIVGQVPIDQVNFFKEAILTHMKVPVTIHGREMVIPASIKFSEKNWKDCS